MLKVFIEDIFDISDIQVEDIEDISDVQVEDIEDISDVQEREEKNAKPGTDEDLIALAEKFSGFKIPFGVFLQAIAIAAYDVASAYRYADNYLAFVNNAHQSKNRRHRKPREPYFKT